MNKVPVEIANFFLAMQAGRAGAEALMALFAEDAVYVEPFTGAPRRHEGKAAILGAMAMGWEMPMRDTRIEVIAANVDGHVIELEWVCHSTSLPGGRGAGCNRFVLRDGLIVELLTELHP